MACSDWPARPRVCPCPVAPSAAASAGLSGGMGSPVALLWHADALPKLIAGWSSTIGTLGSGVSSSIGVLHVPPLPPFPEELHGRVAVPLALADPHGPVAAATQGGARRGGR